MISGVVELFKTKYFKGSEEKMVNFYANWEQSKQKKSKLIELLGGEEHKFEIKITEETLSSIFPVCFEVIRGICANAGHLVTDTEIATNRMNNGRKLSRFLIGKRDELRIQRYLPNRNVRQEIGFDGYGIEGFMQSFYEKVAGAKSEEIVISANYIDILSCGHVSGENSCYTQSIFRERVYNHGQYSVAPHIFANDENTLIAYSLNEAGNKFTKRVWIHVNEERDRFIIGRTYGNFSDFALTALYREMEMLCGDPNPSAWTFRSNLSDYLSRSRELVRYDHVYDNLFYSGDSARFSFKKRDCKTRNLLIKTHYEASCIACGRDHDHVDGSGLCYECADAIEHCHRCQVCGERYGSLIEWNGRRFCEGCADQVEGYETQCAVCGNMYPEVGCYVGGYGNSCPACFRAAEERLRVEREARLRRYEEQRQRERAAESAAARHYQESTTPDHVLEYARSLHEDSWREVPLDTDRFYDRMARVANPADIEFNRAGARAQEERVYAFPSRVDESFVFDPMDEAVLQSTITTMTSRDFQEYVRSCVENNINIAFLGGNPINVAHRDLANFDLAEARF